MRPKLKFRYYVEAPGLYCYDGNWNWNPLGLLVKWNTASNFREYRNFGAAIRVANGLLNRYPEVKSISIWRRFYTGPHKGKELEFVLRR